MTSYLQNLDSGMPTVGIPSFVEQSTGRSHRYYFVSVRMDEDPRSGSLEATASVGSMDRKISVTLPLNDDVSHPPHVLFQFSHPAMVTLCG